jgi:hypothetical protein
MQTKRCQDSRRHCLCFPASVDPGDRNIGRGHFPSGRSQVVNQFFSGLKRFAGHRYFAGWQWLESELRTSARGFLFGRASDVGGNIEGIHDQAGSPAGLLIDEAKTIRGEIFDTLERCHTTFRLFGSSTGPAAGGFYEICTAKAHCGGRSGVLERLSARQ